MLSARKQKYGVNGITWRLYANEPGCYLHIVLADCLFDDIHGFECQDFCSLDPRACRRPKPQLKLPGLDCREDLRADPWEEYIDEGRRRHQVDPSQEPAKAKNEIEVSTVSRLQMVE